jgi:hypothetical protein
MLHPSRPVWFDHPNNIWQWLQIMNLLIEISCSFSFAYIVCWPKLQWMFLIKRVTALVIL